MLQILLKWKTYRTFKSGLLVDFLVKRIFFNCSKFFTQTFSIFWGDKYILEHFFSNLYITLSFFSIKLTNVGKHSFLTLFRTTLLVVSYFFLLFIIFNIL